MEISFFVYLQRLEIIVFFSGYPLIYALSRLFAAKQLSKRIPRGTLTKLLPYGYALIATLFAALQLKNFYQFYTGENSSAGFLHHPFLMTWAFLAILFWIPALAKRPVLSLLHSFVFFLLLLKGLFFQTFWPANDNSLLRNDMKLYTTSLLLHLAAQVIVLLIYIFSNRSKKRNGTAGFSS